MHTCRRILPAVVGLALIAAAVALAPPLGAARTAQTPPVLTVQLFGDTVQYRTRANEMVLAELVHADGSKVAGTGFGDPTGEVTIRFYAFDRDAGDPIIRPGDRVTLARFNQRPFTVDIPALTADVDVDADRIVGTAPNGAALAIAADYGVGATAGTVTRDVTADASGAFSLDLAGQVDLPAGAVNGAVTYDTPQGHRFIARFAAFSAAVTIGAAQVSGTGTPGTTVELALRRADGQTFSVPPTEVTGGTSWTVGAGGRFGPGPVPTVVVGDTITVTRHSAALPGDRSTHLVVPAIDVAIDPSRDRVSGAAPAGSPLTVTAVALSGESVTRTTAAGADGSFEVDLAGTADLGPGWRVRAASTPLPDMSVGRMAVIPQAMIGVDTTTVRGVAEPGSLITITLRAGDGRQKHGSTVLAGDEGDFATALSDFGLEGEVSIDAGDEIEVAFVGGDPLLAPVPSLTARSDVGADTVSGTAPPLEQVRVVVSTDPRAPVVTVSADAQGRYSARLPGYDLRRPADGRVAFGEGRSLVFYTAWSAVQLNVQRSGDSAYIAANGPPGRPYAARLVTPDGAIVGSSSGRALDPEAFGGRLFITSGGGNLALMFTDVAGDPVIIRAGDRIELDAGDDTAELVVPPLEAAVFVEDDVIAGRTAPGTVVTVDVESPLGELRSATVTADATGAFLHDFGTDYDLQYNDDVRLGLSIDEHTITAYVAVPGLTLDLDTATLVGVIAPDTAVTVWLRRGAQTMVEQKTRTMADGSLLVRLLDRDGVPVEPIEGDRLVVHPTDPPGSDVWMDVPKLVVYADAGTDEISGMASPGGLLVLLVDDVVLRVGGLGVAQAWPEIDRDGAWAARTVPTHDVQAGTVVRARYRVGAGHIALRTARVPLAQVEHGGARVCGIAAPDANAEATLFDASGAALASGSAWTSADAEYRLTLRDDAERPVAAASKHRLQANLAGTGVDVALPELSLTVDWSTFTVEGRGPANTRFLVQYPSRTCLPQDPDAMNTIAVMLGDTGPAGNLMSGVPFPLEPGGSFEISLDAPGGHRVFKQIVRTLGRVFIERDRVSGLTTTLAPLTVRLTDAGGTVRATRDVAADADGVFDARLSDAQGTPAIVHAGDVVVIGSGTDNVAFTVEPLSFDWSPGEAVIGQAPVDRNVDLQLRLRSGRVLSIPRQTDAAGTFRFGATDVPPRATWKWSDVTAVRAVLRTEQGHEIISQTDDFEAPAPHGATSIYLPVAHRGLPRATSAASARARSADPRAVAPAPSDSALGATSVDIHAARWELERRVASWQLAVARDGR